MQLPFDYLEQSSRCVGIDALWTYSTKADASDPVSHIVLPDGCMDLIWRSAPTGRHGERYGSLLVTGASATSHTADILPGTTYVGVRFAPGWGGACLRLDAAALAGQVVPAQTCGSDLAELAKVLTEAPPSIASERLQVFARTRTASVRPPYRIMEAIRLLRTSGGRVSVGEVAALTGLSQRTLRREVQAAVGLAPKPLARVFRFRRSLQLRKADRSLSLAALALEAGYADQAHMTREFRELGGFAPARFPPLLVS